MTYAPPSLETDYQGAINAQHRSHLLSEGFSDAQIAWLESIGVRSITELEAKALRIGCEDDSGRYSSSSGLYFPFTSDFGQLRCDHPPTCKGKPVKYLTPCGKQSSAYLPEDCEVVTEGFKDAAAGTLHGRIPTGAIAGVSHYKALKPSAGYTLLYDADGWRNPQVFTQLFKAGLHLGGRIQLVPKIPGQPKAGLCEYFKAGHTAEEYRALIDSALDPEDFLLEIPKHWEGLESSHLKKCIDAILKLAVMYLSKEKTNQLIQILAAIGLEIDNLKDGIFEIAQSIIDQYRQEDRIEELARLTGGYLWAAIEPDKIFFDHLRLIQRFGPRLRFNLLKKQVELDSKPFPVGTATTQLNIRYRFRARTSSTALSEVLLLAAERNAYNPIVEYLDRVSVEFGNNTEILRSLAERYFGQSEPIYDSMIKRFLIAAVARAYEPGCKVDTALILQGKQGAGKSTFFKLLAGGDQYFDDSLGNVGDKDEKLKLHRVWFVEWAELETVFRRKDVAATKAFLSSSTDFVRPPYGRDTEEMQRSSVIVGTTNQDEFLSDSTGNRRFWVIPVLKDIDIELLKAERDRIWAAAVALYKAGEKWWFTDLEEVAAAKIAEQFQTSDVWSEPVLDYVEDRDFVTTPEILENALQVETSRQSKSEQMRVADILKKAGWKKEKNPRRIDGKQVKGWTKLKITTIQKPELSTTQQQVEKIKTSSTNLPIWAAVGSYAMHGGSLFKIEKIQDCWLIDPTGEKHLAAECTPEQIPANLHSNGK